MKVKNVQKRSKVIRREVTWLHRLCLGDMVGLSGHISGTVVTVTVPVSAVHHPDHAAPLLGLQTVL